MRFEKKEEVKLKYPRKELYIRYSLILLIGIITPMLYIERNNDYTSRDYYTAIVLSIIRTAALWLGCKEIVIWILKKSDFFTATAKTLIYITLTLIFYTITVIYFEILALEYLSAFRYAVTEKLIFYESATLVSLLITTIYFSTFFFLSWKENMLKTEKLEKATLEAKYETLKNQINPHFLFNSLNTLMGMMEENSETSKYVQNLSDFLRYILQTREKELVTLQEEIEFSKQYSFIQQKRFNRKLTINFTVEERFNQHSLPPLALQMLIENAIKHNIISKEHPLTIDIWVKDNMLMVENNLQRKKVEDSTGLGLENIRNRYKFLGAQDIFIFESTQKFLVGLPLLEITY
jgi:sensor histidine kinase YesM